MKKSNTFFEQYEVTIDYPKSDGLWMCSHIETVWIPVEHGQKEKSNHDVAALKIKEAYPTCEIKRVVYC